MDCMHEAAGVVGSRGAAADAAADEAADAPADASAAVHTANGTDGADGGVDGGEVDEVADPERLLADVQSSLVNLQEGTRKRYHAEMHRNLQSQEMMHNLHLQSKLKEQKTRHDEQSFQDKQTIKRQEEQYTQDQKTIKDNNAEITKNRQTISHLEAKIQDHLATIRDHVQEQKHLLTDKGQLEQQNAVLQATVERTSSLCLQLNEVMTSATTAISCQPDAQRDNSIFS